MEDGMTDGQREGGCFCGAVRYVTMGDALTLCCCHCESCRWAVGAPQVPWGTFPRSRFRVTRGQVTEFASSPGVTRSHCADCGTSLTYSQDSRAGEIDITLASFDDTATKRKSFTPLNPPRTSGCRTNCRGSRWRMGCRNLQGPRAKADRSDSGNGPTGRSPGKVG